MATNKQGYLPNGIIHKATDADALDGIDSTGFYTSGSTVADSNTLDGLDSTESEPPRFRFISSPADWKTRPTQCRTAGATRAYPGSYQTQDAP